MNYLFTAEMVGEGSGKRRSASGGVMGANREPGDCWLFMAGIDGSTDCLSGGFLFYAPVA